MKKLLLLSFIILSVLLGTAYAASVEATPTTKAEAYFAQGYLYYTEKSYDLASQEFIKSLKYDPNMVKARYWLAKTSYQAGNYASTINQCEAGLKIDPGNKNILALRERTMKILQKKESSRTVAVKTAVTEEVEKPATETASTAEAPKAEVKVEPVPAPKPVIKAVKPALKPVAIVKRTASGLISMDLRNVDISSVLQIFSKQTGISVVAGKDVYGKVTVVLNNVTPEEALEMILKSNGYTYTKQGNIVQVYSSGEPARIEELPGGIFVRTFMINYIGPDELKDTIAKLMPENTNIYTTKGSKTVVVKGTANDIRRAEILIRNLDIAPRQVMVEAKIIEVSLNETQTVGMNHAWTNPNNALEVAQTTGLANAPSATGSKGLYYSVTDKNLSSLVEALSTRTGFNVLSSPKVMALNEQKAEIITGSRLGYKVKTTTTTGMVESVEFLDVGTKLVITPSIKSDGLIIMDIHPEISEGAIVGDLPQKNSTETTTQLIVRDGQTIVIGGLIRDTSKKETKGVPVLMDIPFIGALLKRTDLTSEKKEVIVLITPHIVTPKFIAEMDLKMDAVEQQRKDITPVMPLDLIR